MSSLSSYQCLLGVINAERTLQTGQLKRENFNKNKTIIVFKPFRFGVAVFRSFPRNDTFVTTEETKENAKINQTKRKAIRDNSTYKT